MYFLAGGVLSYVFFIWDQIIDPVNAPITHLIQRFLYSLDVSIAGMNIQFFLWHS
jgi:hypothetical protein